MSTQVKAMEVAKEAADSKKLLWDVLGPEEAAKYSQFKEEERQREKKAADTAQLVGS